MAFIIKPKENVSFSDPNEMYRDYKKRKINGIIDYQSDMIKKYMEEAYNKSNVKNVAFELPTGSGKTLIGLLIAEFLRKKNKHKVLYLCSTKQLVNQVVTQSNSKFGIDAIAFTGSKKDYSITDKNDYERANKIAVSTYSSLFNVNTFFNDVDILIFDDAHSADTYIASNWTLQINKNDQKVLFTELTELFKDSMSTYQYDIMIKDSVFSDDMDKYDKIPNIKLREKILDLYKIVNSSVEQGTLYYPWQNIKENLHACNVFLSYNQILIKPLISPTLTYRPFADAKQRIYMSATLGNGGELERTFGVTKIKKLEFDRTKNIGIGRRFFMFPNASFEQKDNYSFMKSLSEAAGRMVILTENDKQAESIKNFFGENIINTFSGKDIELSKDGFLKTENGVVVLSNRYDGVDFPGDECRMLVMFSSPKATNIQDKFLISRFGASILYREKIKTKLIQAIGRCTRSTIDYAAVCIFGDELTNTISHPKNVENFPPELQAEIEFGYEQSEKKDDFEQILENLNYFLSQSDEWQEVESVIQESRNEKIKNELTTKPEIQALNDIAKNEVQYQYALWRKDYDSALTEINCILSVLNGSALQGYRGFWNYLSGCICFEKSLLGEDQYYTKAYDNFKSASKTTHSIKWLLDLIPKTVQNSEIENDYFFDDIVIRLEKQILSLAPYKFESKIIQILSLLNDTDGKRFEMGHEELGNFLGYISKNSTDPASPDPWWIINEKLCIVSEDKVYESTDKAIPPKDIREAVTHETWIRNQEKQINSNAEIITVFITNTKFIEKSAKNLSNNIYYLNREDFVSWANRALGLIRTLKETLKEEGDYEWRKNAKQAMIATKITPLDFLQLIKRKNVNEMEEK